MKGNDGKNVKTIRDSDIIKAAFELCRQHHLWCIFKDAKNTSLNCYKENLKQAEDLIHKDHNVNPKFAYSLVHFMRNEIISEVHALNAIEKKSEIALREYRQAIFEDRKLAVESFLALQKINNEVISRSKGAAPTALIRAFEALRYSWATGESANLSILATYDRQVLAAQDRQ